MKKNYCVLIDCPDEYTDVLSIFLNFMTRNWADEDLLFYVAGETQDISDLPSNISLIKCGKDLNYMARTRETIKHINEDYIIVINCDCIPFKKVDTKELDSVVEHAIANNIRYISIWKSKNREQRKYKTDFKDLYYCNLKARYSKSMMANIWQKKAFEEDVLNSKLDTWGVEAKWLYECTSATDKYAPYYCYLNSNPVNILHLVYQGQWIRGSYSKIKKRCPDAFSQTKRSKVSKTKTIKLIVSGFFNSFIPSSLVWKIKSIFKKKVSFKSDY